MKKVQFANKLVEYMLSKTNSMFAKNIKDIDLDILYTIIIDQLEKTDKMEYKLRSLGLIVYRQSQ